MVLIVPTTTTMMCQKNTKMMMRQDITTKSARASTILHAPRQPIVSTNDADAYRRVIW